MARQDFCEMDPLGFRWQATMSLAILLVDLASELEALPDDRVLEELRGRSFPDVPGIFDRRGLRGTTEEREDDRGDLITFDALSKDNKGRRLVHARIVSRPFFRSDLVDGVRFGVNQTYYSSRTRSVLGNASRLMTTSFRATHIQHPDVPSFPGSVIGLDSAWRIAVGKAWRGREAALRSVFAQRNQRLADPQDDWPPTLPTPEDYRLEQSNDLPDSQKPACGSDDTSIWVSGVPNEWLFDQARACSPQSRLSDMPIDDLLLRTEVFLGLYDRPEIVPGHELKRLQPVLEMLQRRDFQPYLRNEQGGDKIIYRGRKIGELDKVTRRIRFNGGDGGSLWSCPIEAGENIQPALAALIVDAA